MVNFTPVKWAFIIMGFGLLLVSAIQLGYFSNRYVLAGIVVLSLVTVISAGLLLITSKTNPETNKPRTDDMAYYYDCINKLLLKRPEGDFIDWSGGQYVKQIKKTYTDTNNKPVEFIGISGTLKRWKKVIIVIYNIVKDDIEYYEGEPSPQQIINPFHKFDPFNKSTGGGGNGFNPYDRLNSPYNSQERGGVNINLGQKTTSENDVQSLADKAQQVMREFDKENE